MGTLKYPVILVEEITGAYLAIFPDFPGLATGGDTFESAVTSAEELLEQHIRSELEEGHELPEVHDNPMVTVGMVEIHDKPSHKQESGHASLKRKKTQPATL